MSARNSKPSMRHLLAGALLAIWCAALSGVSLRFAPATLLTLHLVSGLGGMIPIAAYLSRHWWSRRRKIQWHASRNAQQGYVALACLALLMFTGLALIRWTNVPALRWMHTGATVALLFDLALHTVWRVRQRGITAQERPALASTYTLDTRSARRWLISGCVAAYGIGLLTLGAQVSPASEAEMPVPLEHASLEAGALVRAQDCEQCHSDITQQWQRSGHAHAATDAYYQAVTTLFMQEHGAEAVRFCATCHNPIGLMQGEIDLNAAQSAQPADQLAYQARQTGITLPISQRAAEGVTCALCHQAARVAESPANGSLQLDGRAIVFPQDAFARLSLRAVPATHRDTLLRPAIQQAELCGSCHNLHLPDNGLAVEPTFDEWKNSPYPSQGITCQTCHFAPAPASLADSSLREAIDAHGVAPGAPSSLPDMSGDTTLLKKAATLDVSAFELSASTNPTDPAVVRATVTLTNSGAGHRLPTGASDLRQVWLELILRDAQGEVVLSSGILDQYGQLDPTAVQFRKVLGDANGRPLDLHRIWIATQILADTSLDPLETRRIPYRITLARPAVSPYTLTVRLLYRDVSQSFAEFALDRALTADDLPTREMARAEIVVGR